MKRIALYLILVTGIYSCGSKMDCDVKFNAPFAVSIGEEYCFPDGSTFLITEINNSYCPCNAQCVWQGETEVVGSWTNAEGKSITLMIHEVLEDQNVPWAKIHVIKLNDACDPEVLAVELIISKP